MYRTDKQFMKNPATAASRIYIGSLAKQVIADDLEAKFKAHGKILGLVLNTGFAFIQFDNESEAQSAIKGENASILYGRKIVVKQANTPGGNQGNQGPQRHSGPPNQPLQNQQQKQGPSPTPVPPPKQNNPPPAPKQNNPPPPKQNNPPAPSKLNNPPPQKTPPPPQAAQTPPASKPSESDRALKFQPPEPDFQDENMDDDRPNIRPPPGPQYNDDRNRKNNRKPPHRGDRGGGDNRDNRSGRGRSNERDRFMDRFEPPPQNVDMYRDQYYGRDDRDYMPPEPRTGQFIPPMVEAPPPPEKNDCEIIVVSKALTEYAEFIEQKLKTLGLIVDLLFPNEDVPIGKVLANISSRGCLYAILIMPQNEENRSLTLDILHGVSQEHRNIPIEDALILMSRDFEAYMKGEKLPPEGSTQICLKDVHPTAMQMLLNLLSENRHLMSSQYDKLIKYLEERRELQREFEVAEGIQPDAEESDSKQAELQNRIMNILNKSSDTPIPTSITASEPPAQNKGPILKDPTVQKALDSLIMGDMFKSIASSN